MIKVKKEVITSFRYKAGVYLSRAEFQIILHGLVLFRDEILEGDISNKNVKNNLEVQELLNNWSFLIEDAETAIKAEIEKDSKQMPPVGEHDSQSKPPIEKLQK